MAKLGRDITRRILTTQSHKSGRTFFISLSLSLFLSFSRYTRDSPYRCKRVSAVFIQIIAASERQLFNIGLCPSALISWNNGSVIGRLFARRKGQNKGKIWKGKKGEKTGIWKKRKNKGKGSDKGKRICENLRYSVDTFFVSIQSIGTAADGLENTCVRYMGHFEISSIALRV